MPTTVTGKIANLDTTGNSNSFVRFWLHGLRGNEPRITGTGAIAPQAAGNSFYVDLPADANGNVSGTIYSTRDSAGTGNGEIEAGGSFTAVWYGMVIYSGSIPGPEIPIHAKKSGTLDISNVTPTSTLPVVTSPTGDTTYARLDSGNMPFTGAASAINGFTPTSAGGSGLGTAALPFSQVFIGNAATNNIKVTGTGTAARTATLPDNTGTLAELNLAQNWTALQRFSSGISADGTHTATIPSATDTLTGKATTDTLSNKTLTGASSGNNVTLLNWQGSSTAVTGTGSDAIIYTFAVPANTMQAGKGIRVTVGFQHTTGAASVTYKFKYGATTVASNSESGSGAVVLRFGVMNNPASTTAQTAWQETGNDGVVIFSPQFAAPTENTTGAVTVAFTFSVAATDAVTPKLFLVELIQ